MALNSHQWHAEDGRNEQSRWYTNQYNSNKQTNKQTNRTNIIKKKIVLNDRDAYISTPFHRDTNCQTLWDPVRQTALEIIIIIIMRVRLGENTIAVDTMSMRRRSWRETELQKNERGVFSLDY